MLIDGLFDLQDAADDLLHSELFLLVGDGQQHMRRFPGRKSAKTRDRAFDIQNGVDDVPGSQIVGRALRWSGLKIVVN